MRYDRNRWGRMLGIFSVLAIAAACAGCKKEAKQKGSVANQTDKQTTAVKAAGAQDPLGGMRLSSDADPSSIVVKVNGETLTEGELQEGLQKWTRGRQLPPEQLDNLRSQIVDVFISETLILQEGARQKIEVTEEDVDTFFEQMKERMSKRLPEDVSFEEALANNGTSPEELKKDPEFLKQVRLKSILTAQTADLPDPTEEEIQTKYDENLERFKVGETVHARHILVRCEEEAEQDVKDEKKKEAQDIRDQLVEGGDFAALAEEHSDCPSKAKGGDLGTFRRGQMVQSFEEAAFTQKENEIGPVVETPFGYHVIEVLEHNQERTLPLEEVKEGIEAALEREANEPVVEEFIENLRAKAEITYGEGYEHLGSKAEEAAGAAEAAEAPEGSEVEGEVE